jgi:hypothetical protein
MNATANTRPERPEPLLTAKELAAVLKRHVAYVYAMKRNGFPMPARRATVTDALEWLLENPAPRRKRKGIRRRSTGIRTPKFVRHHRVVWLSCLAPLYLKARRHPSWKIWKYVCALRCESLNDAMQAVRVRPRDSASASIEIHNAHIPQSFKIT